MSFLWEGYLRITASVNFDVSKEFTQFAQNNVHLSALCPCIFKRYTVVIGKELAVSAIGDV